MKIAFDMDGVLKPMDLGFLHFCVGTSEIYKDSMESFRLHSATESKPLFNPMYLAMPNDVLYVISNCGTKEFVQSKEKWLRHYYGDRLIFKPVFVPFGLWDKEFVSRVAKEKLRVIKEEGIEVYYDDDPAIVDELRNLTNKVKIMKLSSRII